MSKELLIRTSFVIRSSTWGDWTAAEIFMIILQLFYKELLCCLHIRTFEASDNLISTSMCLTRKWNHQYYFGYCFLLDWIGGSLSFPSTVLSSLQSWTCIKDHAAFVGLIRREGGQPAEEVKRRKGVEFVEQEAPRGVCAWPTHLLVWTVKCWWCPGAAQVLTLYLYPFCKCLEAGFVPYVFFPK